MKRIGNFVYLFLCLVLMLSVNVHAYIDPSVIQLSQGTEITWSGMACSGVM